MGYTGQIAVIPLGIGGLHTDDPQTVIPPTSLILARNVSLKQGLIEKEPGSRRFNKTAFESGIRAIYDWWPSDFFQRLIVVTGDGKIYRQTDAYTRSEITASGSAPATILPSNQTHLLACGLESAGRSRKLFIFTGKDEVQVIAGDATTRTSLSGPAVDWSGSNQPSFGFLHRGRVIAFGNQNDPHRIYISDDDDDEQFATGGAQYAVFPGEGERLFSGFSYKGRAFLLKYPSGVYFIDDSNPNVSQWGIVKVSSSFGAASAHPAAEVLDDMLLANATGSITSVAATQAFGDVKAGDVLSNLRNESFMRNETAPDGSLDRHGLYYSDKKVALFTYRSAGGLNNDRTLVVDVSNPSGARVTWSDKDQANCLALMKDVHGIQRPVYGSEDGYVYLMDQVDRDVAGEAYRAEFQTPHMDFSQGNPVLAEVNKIYQHIELTFEPTGRWNVFVEVYIDGNFVEKIPFKVSWGPVLDDFRLDRDRLTARIPRSIMKPLHGMGRRISFKVYNEGLRENFKLSTIRVYWKPSGNQQKGSKK